MPRQPHHHSSQPPHNGAIAGARENRMATSAICCWARTPSKRSRMITRPTTMPIPAERPCTARPTYNQPILGASMHSSETRA